MLALILLFITPAGAGLPVLDSVHQAGRVTQSTTQPRTPSPAVPVTDLPVSATPRARFQRWLAETHGRSLPGLVWLLVSQIGVLLVILTVYSWFRKTYFQQPAELAYNNALDIIAWQERLGLSVQRVELRLQGWVLDSPFLIDFFNSYYRQFKPALYISAALCLLLAPAAFRRVRRVFLIVTLIALPMYALYPLAPPRLMGEYGFNFVDTLAVFGGVQSSSEGAGGANQFAAMPSMHIGWTTVAAMWLAAALPWRRIGLIIGTLHVAIMCNTVMVTGNHYWLDIAGGFLVAGIAWLVARSLPDRLPGMERLGRRQNVVPHPLPTGVQPVGAESTPVHRIGLPNQPESTQATQPPDTARMN